MLDFGIAKIHMPEQEEQPALTRMGTIFGTPEYMSPEQALGQNADARTDLYSLGIIMYEMLTGRTPFADKELVAVLTRQMTDLPPPLPSDIDPSVVAFVSSLLSKKTKRTASDGSRSRHANRIATVVGHPSVECDKPDRPLASVALKFGRRRADHGFRPWSKRIVANSAGVQKQSLPPWLRNSLRVGHHSFPVVLVLLFRWALAS